METTLDIPEVQVRVRYPGDADGLDWRHTSCFIAARAAVPHARSPHHSTWYMLSSAGCLGERHCFLNTSQTRSTPMTPSPRQFFRSSSELRNVQASILGGGDVEDTQALTWVVWLKLIILNLQQRRATGFWRLRRQVLPSMRRVWSSWMAKKSLWKSWWTGKRAKTLQTCACWVIFEKRFLPEDFRFCESSRLHERRKWPGPRISNPRHVGRPKSSVRRSPQEWWLFL